MVWIVFVGSGDENLVVVLCSLRVVVYFLGIGFGFELYEFIWLRCGCNLFREIII